MLIISPVLNDGFGILDVDELDSDIICWYNNHCPTNEKIEPPLVWEKRNENEQTSLSLLFYNQNFCYIKGIWNYKEFYAKIIITIYDAIFAFLFQSWYG